jgi:uncharacterized membrane protein
MMAACHRQIKFTFIAAVSLLAACDQQDQSSIDEDAIDDVWHKAKLRGVAFRAIGQEPGWLLEITNGEEILLVTNYGENRQNLPYVDPIVYQKERRTEYVLDSYSTTIEIRGEHCTDSMSGESFEVTVTLFLQGRKLQGCGRALF